MSLTQVEEDGFTLGDQKYKFSRDVRYEGILDRKVREALPWSHQYIYDQKRKEEDFRNMKKKVEENE